MFTVYALYSSAFQKIYVGYTSNLEKRLKSHNELSQSGWTRNYRPWVVIHTEHFESKTEAIKREKALKSGAGRKFVWELIRNET